MNFRTSEMFKSSLFLLIPHLLELLGFGDEFLVESAFERLVVGDSFLQL